jgi:hypothetical protein
MRLANDNSARTIMRICALAIVLMASLSANTQAKEPTLTRLFPAGAGQGQTVKVSAGGTFDQWPTTVWVSGRGVTATPEKEKGQLRVVVAADAEIGVHMFRVYDKDGASSLVPFLIERGPEILEAEPNDDPQLPQKIDSNPVVINGRLSKSGDVDGYAFALRKGQKLTVSLQANTVLKSPMDGVLQLVSPAGFVVAQNDDMIGKDPRIVYDVPADGRYIARVFAFPSKPDSTIAFAGGDTYIYRLTVTTGGFLDFAFPFTIPLDCPCQVEAMGTNIPDAARMIKVTDSRDTDIDILVRHDLLTGSAYVRRVGISAAIEAEPNDREHPHKIAAPVSLSGRIDSRNDIDAFAVRLTKGQAYKIAVESRSMNLPLDAVLQIVDASGKILNESDDQGNNRDPELKYTPTADGEYRVVVSDLNRRGGPRYAYLLTIATPVADFRLSLAAERFDAAPGKPTSVIVTIDRKDGFAGPIEITAKDLPSGFSAKPVTSKKGDASEKSVTLSVVADDCACPGAFQIVGKSGTLTHLAELTIPASNTKWTWPWIAVKLVAPDPKKKP